MLALSAALALQSPTYRSLSQEAQKDPAAAVRLESASAEAARTFTGEDPLPFHVQVLTPVELIDPAVGRRATANPQPPAAPDPADDRPAYHFEGKRPMGGLTIYTPVQDRAGRDNATRASGSATPWGAIFKKALPFLALIAVVVAVALLL